MKTTNKLSFSIGFLLAVVMVACDPVGNIDYTEIPVVPGERQMVVRVLSNDGPLTGFNLEVTGPSNTTVTNATTSAVTITNLADGNYTITATRSGYAENEVVQLIQLPGDISSDYSANVEIRLSKLVEPVVVSATQANTVTTAPDPVTGQQSITATIPANAFPPEVRDANGNVNFGITRASGINNAASGSNLKDSRLLFQPSGFAFSEPVELEIELAIPEGITNLDGLYYLEDEDGNRYDITFSDDPSKLKTRQNEDGEIMFFNVGLFRIPPVTPVPSSFNIVAFLGYTKIVRPAVRTTTVGSSPSCGAGVTGSYRTTNSDPSNFIYRLLGTQTLNFDARSITEPGTAGFRKTVTAKNDVISYTVSLATGTPIGTYNYNTDTVLFETTSIECHNSGGGN